MLKTSVPAEEIRKLYMSLYEKHKEEIDIRVKDGIEKYRKGGAKIRLTDKNGNPIKNQTVRLNQVSHDFKYGANIFMLDELGDENLNAEYRKQFKEYFNAATVPFYWNTLEPQENRPRYDKNSEKIYRRPAPELCMEYCEENGISPKLHCLVYESFTPEWLHGLPLRKVKEKYEKRFKEITDRFSGRMFEFEVINELLQEKGWKNKSVLSEQKDIIEWSFRTARKYFPDETLVINEGNPIISLADEDYRSPLYMMIDAALLKGAPIDKIGLQHHLFTGALCSTNEEYDAAIKEGTELFDPIKHLKGLDIIAELGLPLEITEVTVPTFDDTEEAEQLQADILKLWYSIWFSHPAVNTIVYWNTVEGYAYEKPGWNENYCRGGIWHKDLTPKKSALMIKHLFLEEWHTDLTLTTDENGEIDFRGFFGDYLLTAGEKEFSLGLHKGEENSFGITL